MQANAIEYQKCRAWRTFQSDPATYPKRRNENEQTVMMTADADWLSKKKRETAKREKQPMTPAFWIGFMYRHELWFGLCGGESGPSIFSISSNIVQNSCASASSPVSE